MLAGRCGDQEGGVRVVSASVGQGRGTNVKRRPPSGNLGRFGSIRGARSHNAWQPKEMSVHSDCFPSGTLKGGDVGRTMENTRREPKDDGERGASSARTSDAQPRRRVHTSHHAQTTQHAVVALVLGVLGVLALLCHSGKPNYATRHRHSHPPGTAEQSIRFGHLHLTHVTTLIHSSLLSAMTRPNEAIEHAATLIREGKGVYRPSPLTP